MLTSINIHELDGNATNRLLARIQDWRSGICPDGTLATEPCFVLKQRPTISIHPDQSITNSPKQLSLTTEIITERDWSSNLVDCGAITHLNDDFMMKTLSDFYMIFHATEKIENCNTLHLLQLRKHASFKVDHIERPTKLLQIKLDGLLATEDDLDTKWNKLLDIWNVFGYLWPRKIILGYRTHLKATYKFVDILDGLNGFYYHVSKLKDRHYRETQKDSPFDLEHFLDDAAIIARQDMAPLHDFLDVESRLAIEGIIHVKFVQISVHQPIKIYNISTNSYLCWDPYGHSQQDPSFDGEVHEFLVRAVIAELSELNKSPESQYLWRFTWTPTIAATPQPESITTTNDTIDPAKHRSQTLRGCTNVYIYPACKSVSPKSKKSSTSSSPKMSAQQNESWQINDRLIDRANLVNTHIMVLSCRPYRYEAKSVHPEFSKLRALRLLASDSSQYINEKIDWTIEYPNNNLKYMNDAQANIKLNIHEHVRRFKPLINGDLIQLQQIGLLTAFNPINKANNSSSPQQSEEADQQQATHPTKYLEQQQTSSTQSLRTTKRISVTRKPSLKSKNKKNVLCVDEDITVKSWRENTFWRVELATKVDMIRHSSNFVRWPPQTASDQDQEYGYPSDYHPLLSEDVRNHLACHLNRETGSLISSSSPAAASSLRRTRSLGSIANLSIHARDDSEKAVYFEDLVTTKSKSKILSQIAKVSIQPLAQLVKPSKSKQQHQKHNHISPPPFSSYSTS